MKNHHFASPEPLEQRIAPAGLVTTSFLNGLLTINAADGGDHDVHIVKTGINTFRVQGDGTDVGVLGQTIKNFSGLLTGVLIEGGAGADTFEVTNLSPLKSFRFNGNAGVDSLSTANLKTTLGGRVDITLGSEAGSVNFFGSRTTLHGVLNIDLGGGGGLAGFRSAVTTVDGDATFTGGLGSDALTITGDTAVFRHKLTFNGGGGDDSFTATGIALTVQGFVSMDGGGGTNLFIFGADRNSFGSLLTPGLVDLKIGVGPSAVTFLGKATSILGDLKLDLGAGGGTALLNSPVTNIRDNVQVVGGTGNDVLELNGRVSIGKGLSFLGGTGDERLTATGGLLSVKGITNVDGGSGASIFDVNVVSLAMASLAITGGTLNDTVSIIADGTLAGDVNVQLGLDGAGNSSTTLHSRAGIANGLKFGGALTINMVGATVDVLTIANIQVAKAFIAQTGENVSTVDVSKVTAKSDFKLQTGSGADVVNVHHVSSRDFYLDAGIGADGVNIDNVTSRDFFVDTGTGADELRIERNAAYIGTSRVLGNAMILTGIGADQIRIGNGSDHANLKVSFMGAMTLDAGDGPNMRNDILGSNFFEFIPKITATGGTLTQTEAV